jgi:uncharacterized protein (DUF1810 family)
MTERAQQAAIVGVAEQGSAAVLVTISSAGELIDRRRVEFIDPGLPTHPHHHEGSWAVGRYLNTPGARQLSLPEAVALVEQVRAAAARRIDETLEALAAAVPLPISGIAIRSSPSLPPTVEERIIDHRAQTFADSVMYRETLAASAAARGWLVHWYQREDVFRDASTALGEDVAAVLRAMGRSIGPPWHAQHKLAAAAALAVDSFGLSRFVQAQADIYEQALLEIRNGRKQSHWMWYIFPQYDGLGASANSRKYAIRSIAEAGAYLRHPVLGPRLLRCAEAALAVEGRSAAEVFGYPDDIKLRSSATLFAHVSPPQSVFERVLDQYFDGQRDGETLRLLNA